MSGREGKHVSLSGDKRKRLESELAELYKWKNQECKRLEGRLREEGKWETGNGLDLNQHYFGDIMNEFQRRFKALGEKYGIVPERSHDL